jgi:hypothetical protein
MSRCSARLIAVLASVCLNLVVIAAALAQGSAGDPPCNTQSSAVELSRLEYLKGMIALSRGLRCSGALVTFKGRAGSADGLVLTNGHCSGHGRETITLSSGGTASMLGEGEILHQVTDLGHMTLITGNGSEPRVCVRAREIVYGTMTEADMMLFRLVETYDEIAARTGVKPFVISSDTTFPVGLSVSVPSAPFPEDRDCEVEATVTRLKEHKWQWGPLLRLSRGCDFKHGVSGAPIIRRDTKEVIAVFSTANDGNAAPCELNNPCELESEGASPVVKQGHGYGHFLHKLYTCLNPAQNLDLDVPGCLLAKPGPR